MIYFFDLDGTLTESRQQITPEMKGLLEGLDVVIVSGAEMERMKDQADHLEATYLAQNGNHCPYWHRTLTEEEKEDIYAHLTQIDPDYTSRIEDRGSQITYSVLGFDAPLEVKKEYDPDGLYRSFVLRTFPLVSDRVEVKIAGTTSLDYFPKGHHKGHNVEKLIQYKGWKKEECIYVGDALYEGGNDESVIGIINTKRVSGPEETERWLTKQLSLTSN